MHRHAAPWLDVQTLNKVKHLLDDFVRLFLLDPVSGTINQLDALEIDTLITHCLNDSRFLVSAPIFASGNEQARHLDFLACKELHIFHPLVAGADPIPIQASLEAIPTELLDVDIEVLIRQPARRPFPHRVRCLAIHGHRDSFLHVCMQRHHVIVRQFGQFRCRPFLQGMRLIPRPVGRLEMEVTAEEGVQLIGWKSHFRSCRGGGIVLFVVLSRFRQVGELRVDIFGLGGCWLGGRVGSVEGE